MATILTAHNQWAQRPPDQRFTSLPAMLKHLLQVRRESKATVIPSTRLDVQEVKNEGEELATGLIVNGIGDVGYQPTNWAFGNLCERAAAPAKYLRTLPPEFVATLLNLGIQTMRDIADVGVLVQANGENTLRCATGPNYGRIWNADVVQALVNRFGDGVTGQWRVPGEFGKEVVVNQQNTTLYASDRDFFVFLADEKNRITIPNRRDGKSGDLARGFYVWNSEVGKTTFGISTFLFDYVCQNRMIWGAENQEEFTLRHTSMAPDRFIEQVAPALENYAKQSAKGITEAIADARNHKITDVKKFLSTQFSEGFAKYRKAMEKVHEIEEGRPIETRFDVVTAATAVARSIEHQDVRVALEAEAGKLLKNK